jgi:hypothetical protein
MFLYKDAGYRVKYIWSCDYLLTKGSCPIPLASVIQEL